MYRKHLRKGLIIHSSKFNEKSTIIKNQHVMFCFNAYYYCVSVFLYMILQQHFRKITLSKSISVFNSLFSLFVCTTLFSKPNNHIIYNRREIAHARTMHSFTAKQQRIQLESRKEANGKKYIPSNFHSCVKYWMTAFYCIENIRWCSQGNM